MGGGEFRRTRELVQEELREIVMFKLTSPAFARVNGETGEPGKLGEPGKRGSRGNG